MSRTKVPVCRSCRGGQLSYGAVAQNQDQGLSRDKSVVLVELILQLAIILIGNKPREVIHKLFSLFLYSLSVFPNFSSACIQILQRNLNWKYNDHHHFR